MTVSIIKILCSTEFDVGEHLSNVFQLFSELKASKYNVPCILIVLPVPIGDEYFNSIYYSM